MLLNNPLVFCVDSKEPNCNELHKQILVFEKSEKGFFGNWLMVSGKYIFANNRK
jgi:hypothetical protein